MSLDEDVGREAGRGQHVAQCPEVRLLQACRQAHQYAPAATETYRKRFQELEKIASPSVEFEKFVTA